MAVGLTGEPASHALRCTYAQDRFDYYLGATGSRHEASAFTSMSPGHGDGRSTYVSRVYLRNLAQAAV